MTNKSRSWLGLLPLMLLATLLLIALSALPIGCSSSAGNAASDDAGAPAAPDSGDGLRAIGGTVLGLSAAATALLRLNDGAVLAAPNGPFVFPERLTPGSSYHVVVSSAEGSACSVENGDGTAGAADVTNVQIQCVSTSAALATLIPSAGALVPAFDPTITKYTLKAKLSTDAFDVPPITFTATAAAAGAKITIGGAALASGQASAPITLTKAPANLDIAVTAADGVTATHYSIDLVGLESDYIKASNPRAGVSFGSAVALSGDTLVVGEPGDPSNATGTTGDQNDTSAAGAGAAYVFVRTKGVWTQQAYLKASNTRASALFGSAVALSGDTLVVGSSAESSNGTSQADTSANEAGAAYVFVRTNGAWSQKAYLKASNARAGALFGNALALDGDTLIVGSLQESSNAINVGGSESDTSAPQSGAAYVFARDGTGAWTQQAYLKASSTGGGTFGRSVAISGDAVIVGAPFKDEAYVFVRNAGVWSAQSTLVASNERAGSFFGVSVAITGDTIVVGANQETSLGKGVDAVQTDSGSAGSLAGAAYVFTRQANNTWAQTTYLKASNTKMEAEFGFSVATLKDTILVGSHREWSGATGVGGDETDTTARGSGAAYLFTRTAGVWTQKAYLKASNTKPETMFAESVALTSDTAACGARNEGGTASGVNGDESSTSLNAAGAAYAF